MSGHGHVNNPEAHSDRSMYPPLVLAVTYSRLAAGTHRVLAGLHSWSEDHGSDTQ